MPRPTTPSSSAPHSNPALVSGDTDFGTLLALREATSPSVILLRAASVRRADDQVALILSALPSIDTALRHGAIVILERHRLRLRDLPIARSREEDAHGNVG
jgi:predicted nuclease of predicted toxin-antitoxin system